MNFWVSSSSGGGSLVEVVGLSLGVEGGSCVGSEYVVVTQAEFDQFTASPFRLSLDEAALLAAPILMLWGLAFGIRMAIRVVRDADPSPEEM